MPNETFLEKLVRYAEDHQNTAVEPKDISDFIFSEGHFTNKEALTTMIKFFQPKTGVLLNVDENGAWHLHLYKKPR